MATSPAPIDPDNASGALLPGEATLLGSWGALAQLSPDAGLAYTWAGFAAIFPDWAPLNNALLDLPDGLPPYPGVIRTSVGTAARAGDEPIPADELPDPTRWTGFRAGR